MHITKALIPFIFFLSAGCGTALPASVPTETSSAVLSSKSTPTQAAAGLSTMSPSASPKVLLLIDDFETAETAWTVCLDPECTDSSATGVALTPDHATHGLHALALTFEKNDKPKAVFYIEKPMDLSGGCTVRFDFYHEGTIDGVGFALTTGADAVWHESDIVRVEKGKKVTLTFDLTADNYKTAATNWEFRAKIADRNRVVRLSIILYLRETGSASIDYLFLSEAV